MLGFSGIAHAGFILLGLLTMEVSGYATAMFYISGYVIMNLACFLVLCNVSQEGENLEIQDLKGNTGGIPVTESGRNSATAPAIMCAPSKR